MSFRLFFYCKVRINVIINLVYIIVVVFFLSISQQQQQKKTEHAIEDALAKATRIHTHSDELKSGEVAERDRWI